MQTSTKYGFPINVPLSYSLSVVENSDVLTSWINRVNKEITINSVDVKTVDFFGPKIGYIECDIDYSFNGNNHSETALLCTEGCMIPVLLIANDTNEWFTLLTKQPRIGSGELMLEYAAGNTDGSIDYADVAARELNEEVGISASKDDLIYISKLFRPDKPSLYVNYRFCMNVHIFLFIKKMSRSDIMAFEGKQYGICEDEQITLHLVPFEDTWKYVHEPTTLSSYLMVKKMIESGKIQI